MGKGTNYFKCKRLKYTLAAACLVSWIVRFSNCRVFVCVCECVFAVDTSRKCFTCMLCSKILDTTFCERQGDVYCKVCYGTLSTTVSFLFFVFLVPSTVSVVVYIKMVMSWVYVLMVAGKVMQTWWVAWLTEGDTGWGGADSIYRISCQCRRWLCRLLMTFDPFKWRIGSSSVIMKQSGRWLIKRGWCLDQRNWFCGLCVVHRQCCSAAFPCPASLSVILETDTGVKTHCQHTRSDVVRYRIVSIVHEVHKHKDTTTTQRHNETTFRLVSIILYIIITSNHVCRHTHSSIQK